MVLSNKARLPQMRHSRRFLTVFVLFLLLAVLAYGFQRRGRFMSPEDDAPIPENPDEKTEFIFARLEYPQLNVGGYWGRRGSWTTDYPKADRQFVVGLKRLSRIHARSKEEVVSLDDDRIFNYPWVYAVEVGHWDLSSEQAARLREYLLRGGFLMVDDFHGSFEWEVFTAGLSKVFPDRPVVDIPDEDPINRSVYEISQRFQLPGIQYLYTGREWEYDGYDAHWRAVYDDKGRIMVAVCHNSDLGDAWEHADEPEYPEKWTSQAYRLTLNYIIYAMTH
ncbi:MAG: DUF4159 domain-containing protein [Bryobacterales bacterium]|jgi:hypothetical protein|nr:DUF4159 domain-containing protein [Bryobacterales bacterium]